jgi:hypothetical protein
MHRIACVAVAVAVGCSGGDRDRSAGGPADAAAAPVVQVARGAADAGARAADALPPIRYPASTEGLKQLIGDLMGAIQSGARGRAARLAASLKLPDADGWFRATFGPRLGARLAGDYRPEAARIAELVPLLRSLAEQNRTVIDVARFDAGAAGAVGYQRRALARMRRKTRLYSARLRRPTDAVGFHLWSFVHDGTSFRWVGKMKGVAGDNPSPRQSALAPYVGDAGVPDLLELRSKDATLADAGPKK